MTARLAVALVLLFCVGGFGLAAAITGFAIIDAVNTKLPIDERFAELGWYPPKTLRLHTAYRRLYPDGTLLRRQGVLAVFALICLVLAATLLGFGFPGIACLGGLGLLSIWFMYIRKPRT